jgi:homoserine dehydrogenase
MEGRFYLRFTVEDRPGVLGDIARVLGQHEISISSVIQHESEDETGEAKEQIVPLVIMTHKASEGAAQVALEAIDRLDCVRHKSVRMRVLD